MNAENVCWVNIRESGETTMLKVGASRDLVCELFSNFEKQMENCDIDDSICKTIDFIGFLNKHEIDVFVYTPDFSIDLD